MRGHREVSPIVVGRGRHGLAAHVPGSTFNLADYFLFDRLGEGLGDKVAILFGERSYTYAEVAEKSRSLAAFLAAAGVGREERVLIVLPDTPAFAWAFFAVLHLGAVVAMGNPEAPPADLAYVVEYTRATAVVTVPRVAASIRPALAAAGLRALVLSPEVPTGGDVESDPDLELAEDVVALSPVSVHDALETPPLVTRHRPTRRDDLAIWLFTSGSTGRSKAAMHTHRDFAFNTEVYAKRTVGYAPGDMTVSVPRLFFGYATGTNLMFPFAVGATAALFAERPTPEALAHAIRLYRPTVVTNVPTMMGKLLEHDDALGAAGAPRLDLGSVRFHLSAGEALPPALLRRFTDRFHNDVYDGIGSAEMFHIYSTNRPGDIKPGSLGRVVEGYTLKILSSDAAGPRRGRAPPRGDGRDVGGGRLGGARLLPGSRQELVDLPRPLVSDRRSLPHRRGGVPLVQRPRRRSAQGRRHLVRPGRGGGPPRPPPRRLARRGDRRRGGGPRQA